MPPRWCPIWRSQGSSGCITPASSIRGFGHVSAGGSGSRGVLEVRCHEAPFALEHGQPVGRLVYEPMTEPPEILYGRDIGSNYQGQGLKLSKHFQAP